MLHHNPILFCNLRSAGHGKHCICAVSSADQNEARQLETLKKYNIDKWFSEKVSGKNIGDRQQIRDLLDWVREGDIVYVHDFSRLARSTKDLLAITEQLTAKKVHLISLKENLDTSTATGKLMLTMIAAINEFERQNLLERQAEGIALAKKRGVYKGRKRIEVKDFDKYYASYMRHEMSKSEISRRLGISRPTVDRLMAQHIKGHPDWN